MPNIPADKYGVKVTGATWANGNLDTTGTSPQYKNTDISNANLNQSSVGWTVVISHSQTDYTFVFSSGVYSSSGGANGKGQITGGSVTITPDPTSTVDSWSADAN